jgi:cell division protein FtsB
MTISPRRELLQPAHHWWHRWKISTQKFAVVLTLAAFLSGLSYVLLTNRTAAEGFAIEKLQTDLAQLQKANEQLELRAADLRALAAVDQSSQQLGLEPVDKFEYLPAAGPVASR